MESIEDRRQRGRALIIEAAKVAAAEFIAVAFAKLDVELAKVADAANEEVHDG